MSDYMNAKSGIIGMSMKLARLRTECASEKIRADKAEAEVAVWKNESARLGWPTDAQKEIDMLRTGMAGLGFTLKRQEEAMNELRNERDSNAKDAARLRDEQEKAQRGLGIANDSIRTLAEKYDAERARADAAEAELARLTVEPIYRNTCQDCAKPICDHAARKASMWFGAWMDMIRALGVLDKTTGNNAEVMRLAMIEIRANVADACKWRSATEGVGDVERYARVASNEAARGLKWFTWEQMSRSEKDRECEVVRLALAAFRARALSEGSVVHDHLPVYATPNNAREIIRAALDYACAEVGESEVEPSKADAFADIHTSCGYVPTPGSTLKAHLERLVLGALAHTATVAGMPPPVTAPLGALCICSFCGKHRREVKAVVAGPASYICDECIGLCNDIIEERAAAFVPVDVADIDGENWRIEWADVSPVLWALRKVVLDVVDRVNELGKKQR